MARLLSNGEGEPLRYLFFPIFRFKVYVVLAVLKLYRRKLIRESSAASHRKISPFAKGYPTKLVINHAFFICRELEDPVESGKQDVMFSKSKL